MNDLLFRCVSPLKACIDTHGITEMANALLHDVVPLDNAKLFANINKGYNCSEIAREYAAKTAQPQLQSKVCK